MKRMEMSVSRTAETLVEGTETAIGPAMIVQQRTDMADKIPFDVLCEIFEHYAPMETEECPLETLLLVCKSWLETAQSSPHIWSRFPIVLRDPHQLNVWRCRVSRRLSRGSPNSLYDIQITEGTTRGIIAGALHWGSDAAIEIYNQILHLLTGPYGALARRWRIFEATHPFNWDAHSALSTCLSFPTPYLEKVNLEYFLAKNPILPEAPMLKIFRGFHNEIDLHPDLSTVLELETDPNDWGEQGLSAAVNVVKLTTSHLDHGPYSLPGRFPALTILNLGWLTLDAAEWYGEASEELGDLQAPALRRLTICASAGQDFDILGRCPGLPLSHLQEVEISTRIPLIYMHDMFQSFRDSLLGFLRHLTSLRVLELRGPIAPSCAAKLVSENCDELFHDPILLLKLEGTELELGSGEDRVTNIQELREACKLVDGDWDHLYEQFDRSLLFRL